MILALWPPVSAIRIMARERYDNVLAGVPVCDGRGVTRFVRSRANQHCDCECTDSPLHDVSTPPRSSPRLILIIDAGSAPDSGRHG